MLLRRVVTATSLTHTDCDEGAVGGGWAAQHEMVDEANLPRPVEQQAARVDGEGEHGEREGGCERDG